MTEQRLGFRALVLYVVKGLLPGIVLLLLTLAVLTAKNLIISTFVTSGYAAADSIGRIILFVIGGLYVLSMLLLAVGLGSNLIYYFTCRFYMDDYSFKLRRGLISRDEVSIPYRQIQDVNVDQSVIGRLFGIGKMIIVTGGNNAEKKEGEESDILFNIIDISMAKYLQKTLLERSSVQLVKEVPKV